MKEYWVTFTQNYEYKVEADSESEAEEKAYELFESEMRYPVANIDYDEIEIRENEDEEGEENATGEEIY